MKNFGVFPWTNKHGGWYLSKDCVASFMRERDAIKRADKMNERGGNFVVRSKKYVKESNPVPISGERETEPEEIE